MVDSSMTIVEEYGEQKLKELHDSWSLDYKSIYSKDLKELAIEWQEFVFGSTSEI